MSIVTRSKPKPEQLLEGFVLGKLISPGYVARNNITSVQEAALELYEKGFNVFPQPYRKKGGLLWKEFQFTQLEYGTVKRVFAGQVNIAVMPGKTSNDLFVFDCETESSFLNTINQLRQRDINVWAYATSRGGHIWLHSLDGEVDNVKILDQEDRVKQEIRGKDRYMPTIRSSRWFGLPLDIPGR